MQQERQNKIQEGTVKDRHNEMQKERKQSTKEANTYRTKDITHTRHT